MKINLEKEFSSWAAPLKELFSSEYFQKLSEFIHYFYEVKKKNFNFFVERADLFNPFFYCDFKILKLVIIKDEPSNSSQLNNGLCFAKATNYVKAPTVEKFHDLINNYFFCNTTNSLEPDLVSAAINGILFLHRDPTYYYSDPTAMIWDKFNREVLKTIIQKDINDEVIYWLEPKSYEAYQSLFTKDQLSYSVYKLDLVKPKQELVSNVLKPLDDFLSIARREYNIFC